VNFSSIRRGIGLAVLVVAVAVLAFGAWELRTLTWSAADGQVRSCTLTSPVSRSSAKNTQYSQHCEVTWTLGATRHEGTVDFAGRADPTGTMRRLLVNGDEARAEAGRVFGFLLAGMGLLLGVAGLMLRRVSPGNR